MKTIAKRYHNFQFYIFNFPLNKEDCFMTVKSKNEKLGQGVGFERIRRITGYLVGTMDKWNDAKRAEERDRVKHSLK